MAQSLTPRGALQIIRNFENPERLLLRKLAMLFIIELAHGSDAVQSFISELFSFTPLRSGGKVGDLLSPVDGAQPTASSHAARFEEHACIISDRAAQGARPAATRLQVLGFSYHLPPKTGARQSLGNREGAQRVPGPAALHDWDRGGSHPQQARPGLGLVASAHGGCHEAPKSCGVLLRADWSGHCALCTA